MNFYLFIEVKKGGGCTSACICIGTQSALTTELLDGYLPNLVAIKYS